MSDPQKILEEIVERIRLMRTARKIIKTSEKKKEEEGKK